MGWSIQRGLAYCELARPCGETLDLTEGTKPGPIRKATTKALVFDPTQHKE